MLWDDICFYSHDAWYLYGSGGDGRVAVVKPYDQFSLPNRFPDKGKVIDDGVLPNSMVYRSFRRTESKQYELTDHLGNVRLTFSDYKYETDGWKPRIKVLSKNDYYPFGMMIPENYYQDSTAKTRFGFNGMEREDEIAGLGNSLNFGARQYDSRIARFNSQDFYRTRFASETPYLVSKNNPIKFIDFNGNYAIDPWAASRWALTQATLLRDGAEKAGETAAAIDAQIKTVTEADVKLLTNIAKICINEFAHVNYIQGCKVLDPITLKQKPFQPPFPELFHESDTYVDLAIGSIPAFRISETYFRVLSKFKVTRMGIAVAEWVNKASKMTEKMFRSLPNKGFVDPTLIRFSQETHSKYFKDRSLVSDLVKKLKKNPEHARTIEPITIVQNPKDGLIYSVDNRRLRAAQEAGVEIKYEKVEWDELSKEQKRHFDTKTQGESILERDPDVKK